MKLKIDPVIFVALIAHHASIIISCNCTWCKDMGLSAPAGQVHMSTEMKQGFFVEEDKNGACFFSFI